MIGPPILVSKGNVMIGYNPIYEYAALPDVERIVSGDSSARLSTRAASALCRGSYRGGRCRRRRIKTGRQTIRGYSRRHGVDTGSQKIIVPIMGEGIRAAKVVALLKKPGDQIELDDAALRSRDRQGGLSDRILVRRHDGRMENEGRRHGRDRPGARHDSSRRRRAR